MNPEKPVGGKLQVRLRDAFADAPAAGVTVLLCVENHTSPGIGSLGALTIIARGTTDEYGVTALAHELTFDTDCVLVVETPGWALAGLLEPSRAKPFCLGERLTVDLITETPTLPFGCHEQVGQLLHRLTEVRILVLQGMHYGCQAPVFEMIRTLRRLGYPGLITVMADSEPLVYESTYELQIACQPTVDPQQHSATIMNLLKQRYTNGVVKRTKTSGAQGHLEEVYEVELLHLNAFEENPLTLGIDVHSSLDFAEEVQVSGTGLDVSSQIKSRMVEDRPIIHVDLKILSTSEISLVRKLHFLEPHHQTLFTNVKWCTGTGFAPTDDPSVLGVLVGGEYTINVDDHFSHALGTKMVLGLQPSNWKLNDRYIRCYSELKPKGELTLLHLPFASTYLVDPVEMPEELAPGAKELVLAALDGQIDLMFVYGLHQANGLSAVELMSNVDKMVRRAAKKPCVVFMIYKYQLDGFGQKVFALKDVPSLLSGVHVGEPLYLHETGPLPESVFRLLCQSSTLPAIVGGANTSNLVRMLGIPHLSVEGGQPFHITGHDGHLALAFLEKLLRTKDLDEKSLSQLVDFVIAATEHRGTVLEGYFALLEKWLRQPARDQVLLGLLKLSTILKK